MKPNPNLFLAWLWILLGFVFGMVLGRFFHGEKRKTACVIILLWLSVLLTGCAGIMPAPSHEQTYGKVITRNEVRFIVRGQTTRAEVVARLGGQFRDSPRLPVLAYSWEKPAADLVWWIVTKDSGGVGYIERSHWRAFFVKFDANGRVTATRFASLSGGKSLDEQLENWATRGAVSINVNKSINPK